MPVIFTRNDGLLWLIVCQRIGCDVDLLMALMVSIFERTDAVARLILSFDARSLHPMQQQQRQEQQRHCPLRA